MGTAVYSRAHLGGAPALPEAFQDVFANLPAGVCVVSCADRHGPHGMTASAVSSLPLQPQLVVVCIANSCATLGRLRAAGRFAVNILRADQAETARRFATPGTRVARFAGVPHRMIHGSPILDQALAWLACDLHDTFPGGDHTIVVGAVRALHRDDGQPGEPLVWHDRRFRALA